MTGRPLVLLAVCWLAVPHAHATALKHLDTRSLTHGSHEIVIGRVERVASRWDANRTQILTDVTLRVSRALKGSPGERITLTQLGGEVDGVRVTVHAAPAFVRGEEALVFVWRDRQGRAQVNGLAQGKFEIATDAATGRKTVQRLAPGFGIAEARTLTRVESGGAGRPVPLDALVAEIERTVAEEGR